jgi:hypothetical protein
MQPSMATMTGYLEYSSLTLGMITVPKVCLFLPFSSTSMVIVVVSPELYIYRLQSDCRNSRPHGCRNVLLQFL